MKPILYKANATDFSHMGLGVLADAVSVEIEEERNGKFELEMDYPIDGALFKELAVDRLIKIHASPKLKNQRFKIIKVTKPAKGMVTVIAEHISYLSQDLALKPVVTYRGNATQALNTWRNNIVDDHPFTTFSDISTVGNGTWRIENVENARRALGGVVGSMLDTYGGEYRFDNYHIGLYAQRGDDTGVLVAYGKNITDLEQEEEIASTYTSVYPFSVLNNKDGSETVITLPEYFIDSKYVDNFARRKILVQDFSEEEIATVKALRSRTQQYIEANNIGVPKVNIRVSLQDLRNTVDYKDIDVVEELNLCDLVNVYYEKLDIQTKAKIIRVVWDGLLEQYKELEIGEARASLSRSINATVDGRLEGVTQRLNTVQVAANGKNKIYRQADEPTFGMSENDLWYKPVGDGEMEMYQWNGTIWELIISTGINSETNQAIEQALSNAEQDRQNTEAAIAQAKLYAATLVENQDAIYRELFAGYDAAVDDLTQNIGVADGKANDALEKAGASETLAQTAKEASERAETTAGNAQARAQEALGKADDALGKANNAIGSIEVFTPIVSNAVSKADEAIEKANNIPATVDTIITNKGLVSGDWVETRIDDVTGEINYALTSVRGAVPDVIMGVEWNKVESPQLFRTGYVEDYVNLNDYNLQTAEFNVRVTGIQSKLRDIEQNKLDAGTFTSFKNNEYTQDVSGIRNRLTNVEKNKLDGNEFESFKEHEYSITVDGLVGQITDLERDKLDSEEFVDFKTNEYQLTVDGFNMALTRVSGAIPNIVLGVEWGKVENPSMARTDYTEEVDLTDYNNPDFIMGVSWDKEPSPVMVRTDGLRESPTLQEYQQKTAEYDFTIDGMRSSISSLETTKLDANTFSLFKANDYQVTVDGINRRISTVEESKLDGDTFTAFRTNEYQVTVNGITGSIESLESEKLDGNEFNNFKTNDYEVTVDGIRRDITSVQDTKLDGATFTTFRNNEYSNTVTGITNRLTRVETEKLESSEYQEFKENDYQVTVDGLNMALTSVSGSVPNYVFGVEWEKVADPTLIRTHDVTEATTKREFELFLGDYNFRADGWDATNTYINNNSTAINSLISNASGWQNTISYVDENQTKFNETIAQVDSYKQTIGSNGEKITQLVMTDGAFITRVGQVEGSIEDFVVGVEWDKEPSPTMLRTGRMDNFVETQVAQLADSWALNLKSGTDIKTAINATVDGLRFKGELIHLESGKTLIDNAIIKSAHIDSLNANKITGTEAEFATLRTKVLTANVIKSTHIETSTATIDKLFATTASVNTLTSNTAFISSIRAIDISADRITTGTLNAANVNLINVNVNSLVGNTSNFITSNWNANGSDVRITGNGILSTASDGSQTYIQNGIVGARNPSGATLGHIGYHWETNRAFYHIQTSLGTNFAISALIGSAGNSLRRTMLDILPGSSETYIRTNDFRHVGATGDSTLPTAVFSGRVRVDNELRLSGGNIVNPYGIYFDHGGSVHVLSSNSDMRVSSNTTLRLRTHGTDTAIWFDRTHAYMLRTLSMQGNNITNQSDARLKTSIVEHKQSSLSKINAFNFVDFTWIESGREDFGLIAQEVQQVAPELISEDGQGILSINNTLLNMMTTHAIQELSKEHENTLLVASHAYLLAEQHEDELECLRKEVKELKDEIEELRGMGA